MRGVGQTGQEEGFAPFDAGAAFTAVNLAANVARPCLGKVNTEFLATHRDVRFRHRDEWTQHFNFCVGAKTNRVRYGLHEIFPAIRVNGVVAGVGRNDQSLGIQALGKSGGNREHDAIPERHDRLFHGLRFVVPFWNLTAALEQIRLEEVAHEIQGDDLVGNAEPLAMMGGERDFPVVVLGAVMKADRTNHPIPLVCLVEGSHGIHTPAEEHDDLLLNAHGKSRLIPKGVPFGSGCCRVKCFDRDADPPSGGEFTVNDQLPRGAGGDQIFENPIYNFLVEAPGIPKGRKIEFQRFGLDTGFIRNVIDGDSCEIGLPSDRAEGGEVLASEANPVIALGIRVDERLQDGRRGFCRDFLGRMTQEGQTVGRSSVF